MLLARLVDTSAAMAETRSRKKKAGLLGSLLADLDESEVSVAVAYLGGEIPQGRIGLGYSMVYATTAPPAVRAALEVLDVDRALSRIAAISGPGSKAARTEALEALLTAATVSEQDFLRRLILRELRQGALEGIMVDALGAATGIRTAEVRRAAMLSGNLAAVAAAALSEGEAGLAQFRLTLFQPLQPMLAQTAGDATTALARIAPAIVEVKLDGARIQVHKSGDRVEAYTRNLRAITAAIPEVVETVRGFAATDLILDGEVIALRSDGRPHRFQVTMSRFGRSTDVATQVAELPLTAYFFDILHHDGVDLIDLALTDRIDHLDAAIGDRHQPIRKMVSTPSAAQTFFDGVVASGHEGIMIKDPGSLYAAGRRGAAWLKLKPTHTLDLVVLAVEWGSGRRRGLLSNLHLGARDEQTGDFVMLGKTFKGLTDEVLRWQTERFLELETHREGHVVYVRPEQVVEIAYDGIQQSSRYPGGMALRFARVKGYRQDKTADEADTIETVRGVFDR